MRYAKIIPNDVVNGEGVCVSLFTQGCGRHCKNCFNPETWDFNGGIQINDCELISKIINLLHKNGVARNLSLLGGEPLAHAAFIASLIQQVKQTYPETKIWIWSGYTYEELLELAERNTNIKYILDSIDVLIDGPYVEEERDITLAYRGSRNQRIIHLKEENNNV